MQAAAAAIAVATKVFMLPNMHQQAEVSCKNRIMCPDGLLTAALSLSFMIYLFSTARVATLSLLRALSPGCH